ncbi:hypothetical protein ACFYUR_31540 [Micromonospora haikouensis]|uniref:hypothetical protein n=1 Tax=Micromonospora haikouensis TaxID=686309 RepID=UPI0036A0019F
MATVAWTAADVALDGGVRPAGPPDFGPLPPWLIALGLLGALVVAAPAWALRRLLLRHRRARLP